MKSITALLFFAIAEFGKAAIVNISVPEHAVELGANITTTVNEISPNASNPDFDRLDCGIIPPDDPNYRIVVAQYDKHAMMFKTPSYGIPKSYRQRISYEGQLSFVIRQLNFKDKFLKVVCLLNYKNGSKTMHVESPVYEVKVIYVGPKFYMNSTNEGNVTMVQGQNTVLRCAARSFPQSIIRWESNFNKSQYNSTNSTEMHNEEFLTTSTFTLGSPTSTYDRRIVECVVVPQYGRELRRRFILSYDKKKKKDSDEEDTTKKGGDDEGVFEKHKVAIISGIVAGSVLIIFVSGVAVWCCKKRR